MSAIAAQALTLLPGAILIGAVYTLQPNFLPFAIAGASAWVGYRIFTDTSGLTGSGPQQANNEVKKAASKASNAAANAASDPASLVNRNTAGVANPDVFQEFPLTEKNQTSHNTAMYGDTHYPFSVAWINEADFA